MQNFTLWKKLPIKGEEEKNTTHLHSLHRNESNGKSNDIKNRRSHQCQQRTAHKYAHFAFPNSHSDAISKLTSPL